MQAVRTTAPKTHTATLKEFKDHLRIRSDLQDADLVKRLWAASVAVENLLCSSFLTQAWRLVLDEEDFREMTRRQRYDIYLPHGPITSPITSVKYYTTDDVEVLLSNSTYILDADSDRIMLAASYSWPTDIRPARSMVIEYATGYGAGPENVPQEIRNAVVFVATWMYLNRAKTDLRLGELESNPLLPELLAGCKARGPLI